MNTYTWQFTALDVYPSYQGLINAAHTAHWVLTCTDGFGHTATAYGSQRLGPINAQGFIPFAALTHATVKGWVEAQTGAEELAAQRAWLDQQIANQISPVSRTVAPPWV